MATLSLSTSTPRTPSTAAIGALARLLATENIRVEHQPIPTAMFDTASRLLVLPVWRGMSDDLYDMLVGHEVGHALWTPADGDTIMDAIARLRVAGAPNDAWAKSLLNIVEDARVERKIKEKFPGIRRNFTIAYRELMARDIFGLAECGGDPNARGFVDRFNLYHKCGALGLMQIAFTSQEQALLNRGQTTESFEDVVRLCEAICQWLKHNDNSLTPESQESDAESQQGGGAGPGEREEQAEAGSDAAADQQRAGEQRGPAVNGQPSDAAGEPTAEPEGAAGTEPEPTNQKAQYSEGAKHTDKAANSDPGTGRTAAQGAAIGETIQTDDRMSRSLGSLADTNMGGYYNQYGDAPTFDMDRLLVRAEDVIALWRNAFAVEPAAQPLMDSLYEAWKRENLPTVMNMVKRFEQRKAADDARRTMTAKTGRIDCSRLAYFKVSEDLFLSMTTTTDGKSHGLVMLVDWSGSMSQVLGSVVSQVLCLVEFCRKSGVPYEVYAFSDCVSGWKPNEQCQVGMYDSNHDAYSVTRRTVGALDPSGFRMVQFLRSGMSRADHADAVRGLVGIMAANGYEPFTNLLRTRCAAVQPSFYGYSSLCWTRLLAPKFAVPQALSLNGTPLNEGLLACADLVEAFRRRTGAQIVNLAVLTDGDATRSVAVHGAKPNQYGHDRFGYERYPAVVLRWGAREYPFMELNGSGGTQYGRQAETDAIIRYLRDRTGARVYGFYLMSEKAAPKSLRGGQFSGRFASPEQLQEAVIQLTEEGSCVIPHPAYDEFYLVGIATRTEDEDFMDRLDATALTARKIASSFAKGMTNRSSSRTIMVRFTDCFATGKPSQHKMR